MGKQEFIKPKRVRQNPKNISFADLQVVLEDYGFRLDRSSGTSHHVFVAELEDKVWTLTIPYKKPHVKEAYVKKALQAIDEILELHGDIAGDEDDNE